VTVVSAIAAIHVESERGDNSYEQPGKRFQATASGKAKHCERQREYRHRQFGSVTHQGIVANAVMLAVKSRNLSSCVICGYHNRWIVPFDSVDRRRVIKKARF